MPTTLTANLRIEPGDKFAPIAKVAEKVTGQKPHPTTTCRHCLHGVAGVVLPSLIISGKRMTTTAAYQQWIQDVTSRCNEAGA